MLAAKEVISKINNFGCKTWKNNLQTGHYLADHLNISPTYAKI